MVQSLCYDLSTVMRCSLKIHIFGLVQSVGFRYSAAQKARALGLTGWVRNTSDGGVVAVVEGGIQNVNEFVRWCHHGPRGALVQRVETRELFTSGFKDFSVLL
jgi:acylphosphatase